MDKLYVQDYTIGRIICGDFRDTLKSLKIRVADVEWSESSGWIERTFTVRAPINVHSYLIRLIKAVNEK